MKRKEWAILAVATLVGGLIGWRKQEALGAMSWAIEAGRDAWALASLTWGSMVLKFPDALGAMSLDLRILLMNIGALFAMAMLVNIQLKIHS